MADIETSVIISAQIDGLRSGMEAATNSVQAATDAMRTQLAGLGDIAQQAQAQLNAATGQIGTGIGALQTKTADVAGSIGAGLTPSRGLGDASSVAQANPASGNETMLPLTRGRGKKSWLHTRSFKATRKSSIFRRHRPAKEPGRP
jgi:hypothetical protein